jgi:hypothetical protein
MFLVCADARSPVGDLQSSPPRGGDCPASGQRCGPSRAKRSIALASVHHRIDPIPLPDRSKRWIEGQAWSGAAIGSRHRAENPCGDGSRP